MPSLPSFGAAHFPLRPLRPSSTEPPQLAARVFQRGPDVAVSNGMPSLTARTLFATSALLEGGATPLCLHRGRVVHDFSA